MQWGYGTAGTITYPIQFTEIAYTAFACDIAASNENIVSVATNPPEINQIVVRPSTAKTITWLVIGKQQWGSKNVTGDGGGHLLTTINFPVAYAEVCYTVNANIVVTNSDYDIDKFIVIGGVTLSLFKATVDSETTNTEKTFKVNWLAIGQQPNKGYLRSLYR